MIRRIRSHYEAFRASCKSCPGWIREAVRSGTGRFLLRLARLIAALACIGFVALDLYLIQAGAAAKDPFPAAARFLVLLLLQLAGLSLLLGLAFVLLYQYIHEQERSWKAQLKLLEEKNNLLEAALEKVLETGERLLPAALEKALPRKLFTEQEFPARVAAFGDAVSFLREGLSAEGCRQETIRDLSTAMEELFVNIAVYGYPDYEGTILIRYQIREGQVMVTLEDEGIPFDPLAHLSSLSASGEGGNSGGLGLLMVCELMDDVQYEFRNGKNVVTILKAETDSSCHDLKQYTA